MHKLIVTFTVKTPWSIRVENI